MADQHMFFDAQQHLAGVDYPVSRDELVEAAESNGASPEVVDALRGLPDRTFTDPTEVSAALG